MSCTCFQGNASAFSHARLKRLRLCDTPDCARRAYLVNLIAIYDRLAEQREAKAAKREADALDTDEALDRAEQRLRAAQQAKLDELGIELPPKEWRDEDKAANARHARNLARAAKRAARTPEQRAESRRVRNLKRAETAARLATLAPGTDPAALAALYRRAQLVPPDVKAARLAARLAAYATRPKP